MTINLSKLPDPKSTDTIAIGGINGGLNLRSEPTDLQSNQSPDMLNMWYRDGALRKRHGQKTLYSPSVGVKRRCVFYSRLYNGYLFWLEGDRFKYAKPDNLVINHTVLDITVDSDSERGTFIPFEEYLFYKAPGVYIKFYIDDETHLPTGQYIIRDGEPVINNGVPAAYTPIIAINRNPDGTGGDSYQPENRINPYKTVWFDVDKTSKDYYLPVHGCDVTTIQIDDTVKTITNNADSIINGMNVSIHNPEGWNAETNPEVSGYTYIHLNVPMDTSRTGWINKKFINTESPGGNYISNVVFSTMDVYPHHDNSGTIVDKTQFSNGEVIRSSDGNVPPPILYEDFVDRILHQYTTEDWCDYIVLESETYDVINVICMNLFDSGETLADRIVECNLDNEDKPFRLKNYRLVSFKKSTCEIVVTDIGSNGGGWHHGSNWIEGTVQYEDEQGRKLFPESVVKHYKSPIVIASDRLQSETRNVDEGFYGYRCKYIDEEVGWSWNKNIELIWVSENNDLWAFHYRMPSAPEYITGYDGKYFGTYGYYRVTVSKHDFSTTFTQQVDKSIVGFPLKNILYAPNDLVWYGSAPYWFNGTDFIAGTPIVTRTGGSCPDEYAEYLEVAKVVAQNDGVILGTNANYCIAVSKDKRYIGFWFEPKNAVSDTVVNYNTKFKVMYYDMASGNSRIKGVSMNTRDTKIQDEEVELNLDTPAVLSNRIRVTYKKKNEDAFNAISDCKVAIDYGGSDSVCIVMGNCKAQPNAIFWSGNGSAGVDPTYFPMDQYNLVGTYQDGITSLAKYQSFLIVLQGHQTSKGTYSIENNTATNRNFIDISIATINPERGCDLPHTVQLCGNNLVWGNRTHGVLYLSDTSYANENSVLRISENINGNKYRSGLLDSLKDAENVCSLDDGQRYFLFVGDEAWVWDYSLGSVSDGIYNLSWTRHNGFNVQDATTVDSTTIYLLDSDGNINTISEKCDTDFGEDFPCHYVSPTQTFGGYYRKKDITQMIITAQSERGGVFSLEYGSERTSNPMKEQYVPLKRAMQMKLVEREFPTGIVVKPRVLHINNFYFRIDSDGRDGGLSIDNVVIMYTTGGANK